MEKSLFIARYQLEETYKTTVNWDDNIQNYIAKHAEYLNELGQKGSLIFAGRTLLEVDDKDLFGIALFNYSSKEELTKILEKDIAVIQGIQKVEVFPFSMGIQFFKNINIGDS